MNHSYKTLRKEMGSFDGRTTIVSIGGKVPKTVKLSKIYKELQVVIKKI